MSPDGLARFRGLLSATPAVAVEAGRAGRPLCDLYQWRRFVVTAGSLADQVWDHGHLCSEQAADQCIVLGSVVNGNEWNW